MKIIAVLESPVTCGGAFNQSLNAIMQMRRICEERFEFEIFTSHAENIEFLKKLGFNCVWFGPSFLEKVLARARLRSWWQARQNRKGIIGSLEQALIAHGADLVYFLTNSDSSKAIQQLNYITTVFDLCHRDTPEFPEVRGFGVFQARERHFRNHLAAALLVITESEHLSDLILQRYGIDRERCLAMPMSPAPFLQDEFAVDKDSVLKVYGLDEGYFFYPAQFWSHKNHVRILEALVLLREAGINPIVAFSGGDHGNRSHIENLVTLHSLNEQVKFLGFVPAEHIRGLYEGCSAVVMPTYFGPTNLPPLEAWMIGRPLIYSAHLKEHGGDAAMYANSDDAAELAAAMRACTDPKISSALVKLGILRLCQIEQQRKESEIELANRLLQFEVRRKCWAS